VTSRPSIESAPFGRYALEASHDFPRIPEASVEHHGDLVRAHPGDRRELGGSRRERPLHAFEGPFPPAHA